MCPIVEVEEAVMRIYACAVVSLERFINRKNINRK
jgi:hypothetical protein